jgi:DUF3006 family protein
MPERVYLDRIEGDRAVLLFGKEGRETGEVPARLIPAGAREGAALDFSLAPAPDDTTHKEVQDLMDDLFGDQEQK